ncbi:alpha-glucosidase [Xylanibacter ruminicola]|uniref:glycoside hydrolase family 97 protein n=1 Tax=Xylanibacter ruminicola TaxID=839 RepID=UPI0008EAC1E1|nr:glycoside hydrolase family 97 protein [Xylanibacter ruminicola]SFC23243.1 alpha-glucosidase [Xylanibacter ruminicola]
MRLLRFVRFVILVSLVMNGVTKSNAGNVKVTSPDGAVTVTVGVKNQQPFYMVNYEGKAVVAPSHLGYLLNNGELGAKTKMGKVARSQKDEIWNQPWGENDITHNHYNELMVNFREQSGQPMQVVFRVYNDGFGFRYILPDYNKGKEFQIMDELTEMTLAHDAKAWSIPTNHTEYFEGIYKAGMLSQKDTVCTPLTIEYEKDLYLAIHEAALEDYASINLTPRSADGGAVRLLTALTPWRSGVKVYAKGQLKSPWRTMIISKTAGGLLTSNLMLNLNEPSQIKDTSWIEPGRYIGIWWSIHKKQNTWEMGPAHGATTENVKRYMDFAARHGFSGVLAEGWNPGWGQGEKISYLESYPDFDMHEVTRYGLQKGVRFIGHTETWGNASLLESQMEQAFNWFERLGIRAVKTGYVGHYFDGKELAKSQYGIRHYRKVIECAAKHHIMIDNHEPAMPTGIQRTWPNLMTQEGVRGQEYNAWDRRGGNPPSHTVTLPFTRGLAGPTDFTPAIFNFSEIVPGTHPHSTLAKQLGEFVVIYSPLQMAADAIENYEGQPALSFIESCPTTWSRTLVPNGEIGKYITIARKERGGDSWFIGSITNEEARSLEVSLDFLDEGATYRAIIYEDGPEADFERNPYEMTIRQIAVTKADTLHLRLARSGGAAVRIEKAKQ